MGEKNCANPTESYLVGCSNSSTTALRSTGALLLLTVVSGFVGCHGNRSWHNGAAGQSSKISASGNTCRISDEEEAGLTVDLSTDVGAAASYRDTVAGMLKEEKFDEIDCLADRVRSNKERFPGGAWKLHELYQGVSEPVQYPVHVTPEDWDVLLKRLQEWVAALPKSVTARVALASAYLGYAADVRGDGRADTVSEGGWKLFRERTAEAQRLLQQASALRTKCPEWYVQMQKVAQNMNWSETEKRALFAKANKFEPDYYYYARVFTSDLLPKWGGKPGAIEQFAEEIADRVGGDQGDILYFQVAIANDVTCGFNHDPHLSLARIERGFEASEKQYGVSMVNLNRIAFLTARTQPGDAIFANNVMQRIGEQRDEETWTSQDFEMAKNFVAFMGPRLAVEAAADANMKTAEGLRYKASFETPYKELVQQCVRPSDGDVGTFKALTSVGAKGTVEDVRIYWNSPASMCVYEKLHALQLQKATVFPPPPKDPYWVRLDLNWAEFAPVSSK
ncbi:MAG: hypothetical protein JWQ87_2472 [Candidatus Sulfotelmatobacter sp.]|nr:hypothetical protein [Candidatus Sulfotelmatobacter sp.]